MKIFVAGATGVIGRILVPMLASSGNNVVGLTRNTSKIELLRSMGADAVVADALDRDAIAAAIERTKPDVVVHELTDLRNGDYEGTAKLRKVGTYNLVDAALNSGVTQLIAQSYSLYAPGQGAAKEDDPLDLDSNWRVSVEAIVELERTISEVPHHVILRYGNVYGPSTSFARGGSFAELVRQGQVPMTDDVVSFLHVRDAARAVVASLDWPSGVVNIVDDEPAPGTLWLPVYATVIGAPIPRAGENSKHRQRGASNWKARQELHWQPIYSSWRQGFVTELG